MTGWGGDAERRYTLDEAKTEIARRECAAHGHDLDIVQTVADGPVEIVCSNDYCDASWKVAENVTLDGPAHKLASTRELELQFHGWPGKLTGTVVLTDTHGRELEVELWFGVETEAGVTKIEPDLMALSHQVDKAVAAGAFGP